MIVILCGLTEIRKETSLLEIWSAADDTTYKLVPHNERHPIQVFRVPDLVSLIRGSFSKLCPSDLGKAQNVPPIEF